MRPCLVFYHLLLFLVLAGHTEEYYTGSAGHNNEAEHQAVADKGRFHVAFIPSSMLAFVPARSCHVQFSRDFGTFSPPVFYGNIDVNLWCNWTILAAPGKHIVIYITEFRTNEDCRENHDEIIFEGVSSSVENSIVYACWNKHTHVFATQALAVNVVLLWRSFSLRGSKNYFKGRYYVFDDPVFEQITHGSDSLLMTSKQNKSTRVALTTVPEYQPTHESPLYSSALTKSSISKIFHTITKDDRSAFKVNEILVSHERDLHKDISSTLIHSFSPAYDTSTILWPVASPTYEAADHKEHTASWTSGNLEPSHVGTWEVMSQTIWASKVAPYQLFPETPYVNITHTTELSEMFHFNITHAIELVDDPHFSIAHTTGIPHFSVAQTDELTEIPHPSATTLIELLVMENPAPPELLDMPHPSITTSVELQEMPHFSVAPIIELLEMEHPIADPSVEFLNIPHPSIAEFFDLPEMPPPIVATTFELPEMPHPSLASSVELPVMPHSIVAPFVELLEKVYPNLTSSIELPEIQHPIVGPSVELSEMLHPSVAIELPEISHPIVAPFVTLMESVFFSVELQHMPHSSVASSGNIPYVLHSSLAFSDGLPEVAHPIIAPSIELLEMSHPSVATSELLDTSYLMVTTSVKLPDMPHSSLVFSVDLPEMPHSSVAPSYEQPKRPYLSEAHIDFTSISHVSAVDATELPKISEFSVLGFPQQSSTGRPFVASYASTKSLSNDIAGQMANDPYHKEKYKAFQLVTSGTIFPAFHSTHYKLHSSVLGFYIHRPHSTPLSSVKQPFFTLSPKSSVIISDQQILPMGNSQIGPEFPNETVFSESAPQITENVNQMSITIQNASTQATETQTIKTRDYILTESITKPTRELQLWAVNLTTDPEYLPLPNNKWQTSTYADDAITTRPIIAEEKSTYAYHTNSDLDFYQKEVGQTKSDRLDNLNSVHFFGNQTVLGFSHVPGDSLFAITAEIEHKNIILRGLEKELVESVSKKITDRIIYFPNGVNSLMPKEIRWTNISRVILTFWLHLKHGGKAMKNFLKTQLNALKSHPLGSFSAALVSFSVEDVNECQLGLQNCSINAHCVNTVGTYSCHCLSGYEDHSPAAPGTVCISSQPAEIYSLSGHVEILIGSIASVAATLLLFVAILCIIKQRRRAKANFSLQDRTTRQQGAHVRSPYAALQSKSSQALSVPTRHQSLQHPGERYPAREIPSTVELTIEQTAC